jgi:hypothetical protein
MAITLTKAQVDRALPKVRSGLNQYLMLQSERLCGDLRRNTSFRRQFNHFYRVRRGREWQEAFYDLLETRKQKKVSFAEVLAALQSATGRCEASFASKLVATIDPDMPVIDSIVLKNVNLRLPAAGTRDRIQRVCELHGVLQGVFRQFLATDTGRYLVGRFRARYPDAEITEVKMLDLVLWQTRPRKNVTRSK